MSSHASIFSGSDPHDDGYVTLRVDACRCDPALLETLRGIEEARWLSSVLRHDFEEACGGNPIHGSAGSFEGVVAERMPCYWRMTEDRSLGTPIWLPDGNHPLGKWLKDVAARLFPTPPPEVLQAVLAKHGIVGSKEPLPTSHVSGSDFILLVHNPKKAVANVRGVTVDPAARESLYDMRST